MPILLNGIFEGKRLQRELKHLGLRKHDISKTFVANGQTLVYLKDESLCKLFEGMVPDEETVKEIVTVHNYVEKFKLLIDVERLAEIEAQEEEIKRLSGKERELLGRAVLDLKGTKAGTKFHLHLVRFWREKPIETEIAVGDVVLVSRGNPLKSDLLGTVTRITEKTITVAFENRPPNWVYKKGVRVDLYINDVTFKRMEENLEELRHAVGRQREIRNIILGLKEPEPAEEVEFELVDKRLNETQVKAVKRALGAKDFYLIHGPPGTGKTSTITELIVQLVKQGKKVLATADSNIAADNILLNLSKYPELKLVRIGHPARVLEELERYSIFALFEEHEKAAKVREGWDRVRELIEKRDQYKKPVPQLRRGMSDDEIVYFGRKGKSFRGVPKKTMRSMANWILTNYEIDVRIKALKEMENIIFREIITDADVVVSTNSMVKSELLEGFHFDVAVIDEGSQQVEPSTLIPIMRADRFYIAGDHKQLPPTVMSEEAKELEKTLFERLINGHPELSTMLEVQYRMNEKIMEFPNKEFYGGKLRAAESVKEHTLADFNLKEPEKFKEVLEPREPLAFLDTSSINALEFQPEGSTSYENYEEAKLAIEIAQELHRMGLENKDIGIITPYAAQVKLIKQLLLEKDFKVEVNSVDGFQGREKEAIIISFVRSNEEGEVGFLKDLRRLNVAITRARRKLICIGNAETLKNHPVYRRFINYVKENGRFVRV
ncbi:IGHMBP2 family helicase [Phorcysia thermohydrogeniphila]|uniref:Putative DNA helicase n=1 Tax=Phorcysia thermohydrogeniphila TaxID=936138 RepID=A0A4R1GIE7_9BACT|nr:IGHMBP2 family helicase [Phorcysia thermohydrogeniphila]TCK06705.1 putative DNA helicase [Phorcysia thermohydrogeniphila]